MSCKKDYKRVVLFQSKGVGIAGVKIAASEILKVEIIFSIKNIY